VALSNYNQWAERVLAADLSGEGLRLAFTLQRLLLGYKLTEDGLGIQQLRDVSRLHGRSLERARDELVHAGLIGVTPGSAGRGNATVYRLLLDAETSAPERTFETTANLRVVADISGNGKPPHEPDGNLRRNLRTNLRAYAETQGDQGKEGTTTPRAVGEGREADTAPKFRVSVLSDRKAVAALGKVA